MQQTLPWMMALAAVALLVPAALLLGLRHRKPAAPRPLPTEWNLVPRPVFSTDERRVYRQLREALPHHIVLSKLPLVRFCQPNDPQEVRFWYDLLGAIHVTFAICSANGRVLAAIDLDTDRGNSRRVLQIKQAVLGACRVRYLRCPVDHMPSVSELQLLVPHSAATRGPQPAPSIHQARDSLSSTVATRRRERTALWQDSSVFQDSFFSPDSRSDASNPSGFGPLSATAAVRQPRDADDSVPPGENPGDIVGVVVDPPRHGNPPVRH
jgi:hypothetical protein